MFISNLQFKHAIVIQEADQDDDANLANIVSAIFITTAGDVKLTTEGGETITMTVEAKTFLPLRVVKIFDTGTTVTGDIIGLF